MTNFLFNVYKVKSGVQHASLLQGRIINLGIRCTRDSSGTEYFSCLIFKTFGQLSCEYILFYFILFYFILFLLICRTRSDWLSYTMPYRYL